ncbi:glutathione S-transferase/GST-like protein [Tistlia consotensis]|uniref:Glutathione S-transferase/GST-like protein n=1 Tax=Tistlia consotensis USBA 355 TaxID=560819 RepID=A0A1Y6C6D8_9PROT|nr:glutathione S-transferase family protein [Tistlia consotensis]SMF47963.1 glutathione S-transferase/GST-like protein [Tistlia consotensis USBA 355]SNR82033.1 glutathione S-transferase/GST-like protein [Tistlia consotensis]
MYRLYWKRATGAFAPNCVLAEAGAPHERVLVDVAAGEHHGSEYLKLNPRGQIPALVLPDGTVMTESLAIVLQLCDSFPEAGLLPAPGSSRRARCLRWMTFGAVDLYEADLRFSYAERYTVDPAGVEGVREAGRLAVERDWRLIEAALGETEQHEGEGPFLLGGRFTAADIHLAMLGGWHHDIPAFLEASPRAARLMRAVAARPAIAPLWRDYYGHKPAIAGFGEASAS